MKKLLIAVLLLTCARLARADIAVTQGSGKTVATTTDNSKEYQNVVVSTTSVRNGNGVPTAVGYDSAGSTAMPCNIQNIPAVSQSGTWTVQPGNTPNTAPWLVNDATMSVITNSGTSNHMGWDAQGSSMPVASAGPAIGATVAGAPFYQGAVASSSTFPTLQTNGKGQYIVADPAGRLITVSGVPTWMIKTATATITTTITPITLISSGGAGNFNDLCGCLGLNTSATNTYATFQSTGAAASAGYVPDFTLGLPANDIPAGFGPVNCASPIPQRAANTNWLIQINNSITDVRITCYYYTIAR